MAEPDDATREAIGRVMEQALARPPAQVLRPTLVSRLGLAMLAAPAVALAAAGAAWLVVGGVAVGYAGAWAAIGRQRLEVDAAGVRVRGLTGQRALRWDDIDHYTYWSLHTGTIRSADPRIAGRAGGVFAMRHMLVLYGRSGGRIRVDSRFAGAERAVARIVDELHARLGERASFAPFSLDDEALYHERAGALPWRKLEAVKLDRDSPPRLRVLARGKALAWVREPMSRIANGLLFLERLAERGVTIHLGRQQLVHDRLGALLENRAALPSARVVRRDRS